MLTFVSITHSSDTSGGIDQSIGGAMNIEIGGGPSPRHPEYIQVDVVKHVPTSYVCPAWALPFSKDSAHHIYSRHMLEHLDRKQAVAAVREWYRILRIGGRAEVIVPDLAYHAKQLLDPDGFSDRMHGMSNYQHAMGGFYGWDTGPMQHQWGYTLSTLLALFDSNGFIAKSLTSKAEVGDLWVVAEKNGRR